MCGIAGCSLSLIEDNPEIYLQQMNQAMIHRGPDDGGYYYDNQMALCHRRLSIIDLSQNGHQPMNSHDGKLTIVFNGEIYNFIELRNELLRLGYRFNSKTDTEVLLYSYQAYKEQCVDKIVGMYAFAIWDSEKKSLFLCRDRIGKKPLFYYYDGKHIAFASEIKSILQIPTIQNCLKIDATSLVDYLQYLYIPHPKTIYHNIYKLEPGHYLTLKNGKIDIREYWDVDFSSLSKVAATDLADGLLELISDSVKARMIADVPLGAFLSGGIDSSAVVALMAKFSDSPVKTCTIGFHEVKHNEAVYAKTFSQQFNAEHLEYYVSEANDIENIIKKLVWHCDEPFADSSMIPTYHVSRLARQVVTVALSGDGGDESFGGYDKYSIDLIEHAVRGFFPRFILTLLNRAFVNVDMKLGRKIYSLTGSARLNPDQAFFVTNTFFSESSLRLILSDNVANQIKGYSAFCHTSRYYNRFNHYDHVSKLLYTDLKSYLPGDILMKVDRMSMANALEVRSPLLDHRVIEYAAKIPSYLKIARGGKKIILKNAFAKILSSELMNRRKHGFTAPIDKWFRSELKQFSYHHLFEKPYMAEYFKIAQIKSLWDKHQTQKINYGTNLWTLLIFSIWYESFSSA